MPRKLSVLILLFAALLSQVGAADITFDPFLWMEDIEGEKSLEWVKEQNARTARELEKTPLFAEIRSDIEHLFFANDRVLFSNFHDGYFWYYKYGDIRRTTLEEYKKADPKWEIMLDIDELSKNEGVNWVFKGSIALSDDSQRVLISLSNDGKDAVTIREFDFETREFVRDGFTIPEAKTRISPIDKNHLIVGSDFGKGSLTESGHPRILKLWSRGRPLSEAKTVFEVGITDIGAFANVFRVGDTKHILFYRQIDFFNAEVFIQQADATMKKLPLPTSARLLDIKDGYAYAHLKQALSLKDRTIPLDSIIRFTLHAPDLDQAQVLFTASPKQSIESVSIRDKEVFVTILDNIRSQVLKIMQNEYGKWNIFPLPFPTTGIISFVPMDPEKHSNLTLATYVDPLTPFSQYLVHDEDGSYRLELLKSEPSRFDSSKFEVVQKFATSRDGVAIPYFVLKRKDLVADGTHPTILYGYGGFNVSVKPNYAHIIGKVWLERGGVYVIANIRGDGEFGPAWHKAAIKENRQRAYDDFIAVAEDLIAQKFTSPRHLGIQGGSNGGLLVGAVMVQRPELFRAALAQVPLLDMVRYPRLLAGASWVGEYGDPQNPNELSTLLKYSPYHNVKAGIQYPKPLFVTSTKDDRVHPGHARKMAARMLEQGHDVLFYECTTGGHCGGANLEEEAYMSALEYSYLWERLATVRCASLFGGT